MLSKRMLLATALVALGAGLAPFHASAQAYPDRPMLIVHLAILVSSGAAIYYGTTLALWLAMGRPDGPETEIQRIANKVLSSLRPAGRQYPA